MATWRINIKKNPTQPPPAVFSFDEPPQIQVGDQVFWSNDDTVAHWPAVTGNPTFFMDFQIAPKSTSPAFAPGNVGPISYFCSLHPTETGTIDVQATPAPAPPPVVPSGT
jgi:plastocyanin